MSPGFFFRTLVRESRGARGRLAFFVACLAVGVAAVVAVAGLSASLDDGIRTEARQLLAADLAIEGSRPVPPASTSPAPASPAPERTDVQEMVTVVVGPPRQPGRPGRSQLVELKVVDGEYPFYGKLELRPARPLRELLGPETAVVGVGAARALGLREGDTLRIGGAPFRIAGVVLSEPDRVSVSLTLGPRVFLSAAGLARTQLAGARQPGRLPHAAQAPRRASPASRLARGRRRACRAPSPSPSFYRVETYKEAQPALRNSIDRVERFLGLVALLSLFVGGIGVAQSVRAWLAGRLDAIAVLKCLGLRPREIFPLYLGQTALLGLAGSLVGIVLGVAGPARAALALPGPDPGRADPPLAARAPCCAGWRWASASPCCSACRRSRRCCGCRRPGCCAATPSRCPATAGSRRPRWSSSALGIWAMATVQSRSWDLGRALHGRRGRW